MNNLQQWTVSDLLGLHSSVLGELRNRGILRSKNNPTGDYAEWLVATRLNLHLADKSAKRYDAIDDEGLRFQIKGRRITPDNPSSQLSVIRSLESQDFDFLVAVIFGEDWRVLRAGKVPYPVVHEYSAFRSHVNGHVLHFREAMLKDQRIENITTLFADQP